MSFLRLPLLPVPKEEPWESLMSFSDLSHPGPGVESSVTRKDSHFRVTAWNGEGEQTRSGGDSFVVNIEGKYIYILHSL